jgi:Kinesin motor domain
MFVFKQESNQTTFDFLMIFFFSAESLWQIFKEKVYDLSDQQIQTARPEICQMLTAGSGPNRVPIQIRETAPGGITLAGVCKPAVKSKEEMASFLAQGSLNRATASTRMNSQSRLSLFFWY